MKQFIIILSLIYIGFAWGGVSPGEKAPNIKSVDQTGSKFNLNDYKGKYVILEWYNHGCPFVRKHYDSKNMQTIQALYKDNKEVVWVTIVSSAPGKQGHIGTDKEALKQMIKEGSKADFLLRDVDGGIGKTYGAKTTPHIYIIDHNQIVQYEVAIDSINSTNSADIKEAKNYITSAMSKIMLGNKPSPQKTKPYGCSVKY